MTGPISFACKSISFDDLIKCSFELNKTEYNVLLYMLRQQKRETVVEIAQNMDFERSTVQKALSKLVTKELARRLQQNKEGGGYLFYYEIKDKKFIKIEMKRIIDTWVEMAKKSIENW